MAELKLLDPNRKAVLLLPATALKLWLAYFMHESDDQEAYPSLDRLEAVTGMDRKTIIKQRDYLIRTGWLVRVTGYASDRYSKPTRGSHSTPIYRVDDPTKGERVENFHPCDAKGWSDSTPTDGKGGIDGVENFHPRFLTVSVSNPLSLPLSVPVAVPTPATPGVRNDQDNDPSLRSGRTKATTTTKAKAPASGSYAAPSDVVKQNAKYDTPFPYDFDTWSQPDRTSWCGEHSVKPLSVPCPTPKTTQTPPDAAVPRPVGDGDYGFHRCEHCSYTTIKLTKLADHVLLQHPDAALLPVLATDN